MKQVSSSSVQPGVSGEQPWNHRQQYIPLEGSSADCLPSAFRASILCFTKMLKAVGLRLGLSEFLTARRAGGERVMTFGEGEGTAAPDAAGCCSAYLEGGKGRFSAVACKALEMLPKHFPSSLATKFITCRALALSSPIALCKRGGYQLPVPMCKRKKGYGCT